MAKDGLILLTNDDGITSPALQVAAEVLSEFGRVVVVAPTGEQSACSHRITLDRPVSVNRVGESWYSVDGTPVDCVYLAMATLLDEMPAAVVSGPNRGLNLGTDVFYSGTVAAALEGALRGTTGIALSAPRDAGPEVWGTAARLAGRILVAGIRRGVAVNLNLPTEPVPPRGIRVCGLGVRHYPVEAVPCPSPKGRAFYWLGGSPLGTFEGAEGPDAEAVESGYVSATPLGLDLTDQDALTWLRDALGPHLWEV